jgi:DNA polymerase beta
MKIIEFKPYFATIINDLKSSSDESAKFRLKNYVKWLKLLDECDDEEIEIDNEDDINELNIPEKMKLKMIEIFKEGCLNGKKIIVKTVSSELLVKKGDNMECIDLIDFYGFGPASKKTFEEEGITGYNLLTEWEEFIKQNPENEILLSCKRNKPEIYANSIWNCFTEEQKNEKIKSNMMDYIYKNTKYLNKLNYHQLVGVKHYHNIMKKIPRDEIVKFEKILGKLLKKMNDGLILTICGSYRRGRQESGDIDCFITHKDIVSKNNQEMLNDIVSVLTKCNILVDHLTEYGGTKYMGMGKIGEIPRRIDIRVIPWEAYAYAILYFTGSKNHNLKMRNQARKLGYKLNEYGMENIMDHKLVKCETEEQIFKVLGMEYMNPTQRDI